MAMFDLESSYKIGALIALSWEILFLSMRSDLVMDNVLVGY